MTTQLIEIFGPENLITSLFDLLTPRKVTLPNEPLNYASDNSDIQFLQLAGRNGEHGANVHNQMVTAVGYVIDSVQVAHVRVTSMMSRNVPTIKYHIVAI